MQCQPLQEPGQLLDSSPQPLAGALAETRRLLGTKDVIKGFGRGFWTRVLDEGLEFQ